MTITTKEDTTVAEEEEDITSVVEEVTTKGEGVEDTIGTRFINCLNVREC